jgi:hypothetical protein
MILSVEAIMAFQLAASLISRGRTNCLAVHLDRAAPILRR